MNFTIAQTIHTLIFDFDGIFTDNTVIVTENGVESVICDRRDGLGINLLRAYCESVSHDIRILILSKERNNVVSARAKKLGIEVAYGVDDKAAFIASYMEKGGFTKSECGYQGLAYCGNDINDIQAIKMSEYSYAPSDAHPRVKLIAKRLVTEAGGNGFVRAVVELLIGLEEMTDNQIEKLLTNRE